MPITIVTLDDHSLVRDGIRYVLARHADVMLVGEGSVGDDLPELVATHRPDIVLLDLGMPQSHVPSGQSGRQFQAFPMIAKVKATHPETRIIIVSQHVSPMLVVGALETGVRGYVLKDDALQANLVDVIRRVHTGGVYFSAAVRQHLQGTKSRHPAVVLTERQQQVLYEIAANPERSRTELAQKLDISENTLKRHLNQLYRTLEVSSMAAALVRGIQLQLIPYTLIDPLGGAGTRHNPENG